MSRPPTPKQKRYRGRTRANMRSAYNHVNHLIALDAKYRAGPGTNYPNQLFVIAQRANFVAIAVLLSALLQATGPIPDRGP